MNVQFNDTEVDVTDAVVRLEQKYLERRKQIPSSSEDSPSGTDGEAVQRLILAHTSRRPRRELKCFSKALNELFKAVTAHPKQFSIDHVLQRRDFAVAPLQDSQVPCTETDVTLPSCLDNNSPGSHGTEADRETQKTHQFPDSCCSSSSVFVNVYQEMMTIYEQLKTERQSQQQWERELHERERRLKQQEEAFRRLSGLEEILHTRILAVEEKHHQELCQLKDLLQQKNKENRRLKSNFDTIKNLNENMKKQLTEISEQNKKLESQSKRVQTRLENLQRKYEHSTAPRACQRDVGNIKLSKKERSAASGKPFCKSSSSPTSLKLLALLLDWVLDGQTFSSVEGNEKRGVGQCLPPEVVLNNRCLKMLPLLADELHHTHESEPDLLLSLLRLIHWALRHMDHGTQNVALSATLQWIGEEVSKPAGQSTSLHCEDLYHSETAGSLKNRPLYRSPCPHTCILSILIILRTVTQADVLAKALDSLHTELMSEESRGLFIYYEGVCVLLMVLQAGRAGLHTPTDILMQLTEQSRYLNPFLEACSSEEFFQTATQLINHPRLDLPSLEKLTILLQKLSRNRKNRRLFEVSSLRLQIQELYHKTSHKHTFLCLNLCSILHNLK
ncbi:coiled-coil domain-containing protein 138-like isoform X2 [Solea solea]|uniref:coiled-coil domain-containing protein 138-like isoform X2 n=1 Tax=Solea solea TaxID=90069 RepID=UPI00272AC213|nr:coiled-coil domain-containing protein 138-like isoform X2 [Solea solea]